MSSEYDMVTLKRAEVRRQKILDMLHENPGMSGGSLVQALPEYKYESMRGAIANMLAKAEIAGTGPKRAQCYFPLVKTTHTAESVRAAKLARTNATNGKRITDPEKLKAQRERKRLERARERQQAAEPWRTVHIVRADDKPIQKQGGQGALRRDVTVNCQQNY